MISATGTPMTMKSAVAPTGNHNAWRMPATPSTPRLSPATPSNNLSSANCQYHDCRQLLPRHSLCSRSPLSLRLQQSFGYRTCLPYPANDLNTLVVKMPLRRLKSRQYRRAKFGCARSNQSSRIHRKHPCGERKHQ